MFVVFDFSSCGKSTQVPQYVLDHLSLNKQTANTEIIVTQPRRISAMALASRVAQERGEECGKTIGYQIRLESVRSEQTKMLFCTVGILLRRLASDPNLTGVSHLIIDEVHERDRVS